jgi:hypothetical protein
MVEEEKKKGNKPLFKVKYGAIRATGWLNKSQKGEQFVSVDISRSFKKGEDWIEKKVTGLTVKSLTDLESAVAEARKKIGEMETSKQ